MKHVILRIAVCLSATILPTQPLTAQSTEYELAQIVSERKLLMADLQTAYWVLFDVQSGKSTDFEAAADAAEDMPALIDRFVSLLPPGSARGEAPGTRAKPDIWSQAETFQGLVQNFKDNAIAMSQVASAGNPDEFRAGFEAFTAACTGCHGLRPSSGGLFRFGKGE